MAIDICNITPSKVKPGLEGKIILLSGEKKTGKTTFLSKLPDCLIIGLEPGTNLLSGVMVQPCNSWTEFKQIVKQLNQTKLRKIQICWYRSTWYLMESCSKIYLDAKERW